MTLTSKLSNFLAGNYQEDHQIRRSDLTPLFSEQAGINKEIKKI